MHQERLLLEWPADLFRWEGHRICRESDDEVFKEAARLLLEEAFADSSVVGEFDRVTVLAVGDPWDPPTRKGASPREYFEALLTDDAPLDPPGSRRYFAERHGRDRRKEASAAAVSFSFVEILKSLSDRGYFPDAFPRDCPDDEVYIKDVVARASAAIGIEFEWDGRPTVDWSDDVLYSLIEYFHDGARRPRVVERVHSFAQCGPHYGSHVAESGQAVYRWRVNAVLEAHGSDYRLATSGADKGMLVTSFGKELDSLADVRVDEGSGADDEVAHAIRDFRRRGASEVAKRAALALLAGALEQRRPAIKGALSRADEQDLFNIANNWAIRHRNAHQRTDVGEEFLEWVFWNYLATVMLLEQLEERSASS